MKENKITFSFSEKAFVVLAWIIGVIAGYFMPVSIAWKPVVIVAVFASLIAGWVFIENMGYNRRDVWRCFILIVIFIVIFSASWFGYGQGEKSGYRCTFALAGAFFASLIVIILIGIAPFFEKFFLKRRGRL